MAGEAFLVPVKRAEIEIGKPLPWAVYDANHNLLLNRGVVVTTENQVGVLIDKGLYRERGRPPAGAVPYRPERPESGKGEGTVAPSQMTESRGTLDEIRLMPGDALQLQPLLEGQSERFTVRVIGVMKPKSVLVTAPLVDGKLIFVRDAQPFLVRAFSGLNVCAFKSKVLKSQHSPFPYMHLSYPDSVQIMRVRKAMRAPVQIIVAVSDAEGRNLGAGRIVDISIGGAQVLANGTLGQVGEQVNLAFKVKLDEIEEYISTPAVIRRMADEDDEEGRRVKSIGTQFLELTPSQRLLIMNLVYHYMLKEPV